MWGSLVVDWPCAFNLSRKAPYHPYMDRALFYRFGPSSVFYSVGTKISGARYRFGVFFLTVKIESKGAFFNFVLWCSLWFWYCTHAFTGMSGTCMMLIRSYSDRYVKYSTKNSTASVHFYCCAIALLASRVIKKCRIKDSEENLQDSNQI